jgi:hypothetical protein
VYFAKSSSCSNQGQDKGDRLGSAWLFGALFGSLSFFGSFWSILAFFAFFDFLIFLIFRLLMAFWAVYGSFLLFLALCSSLRCSA